jgi:hypothetical protein
METGGGKTIAYVFVKEEKAGMRNEAGRGNHWIAMVIKNDLHFVIDPALGIILIFFVLFFLPFAEIAFAIAFHFRLVPVFAKIPDDIVFVQ